MTPAMILGVLVARCALLLYHRLYAQRQPAPVVRSPEVTRWHPGGFSDF